MDTKIQVIPEFIKDDPKKVEEFFNSWQWKEATHEQQMDYLERLGLKPYPTFDPSRN